MKFRCERDVLVEALGDGWTCGHRTHRDAARAVRACSIELERRPAAGHRDGPRPDDPDVEVTVAGDTDGVTVLPARLTADIVRSLEQRAPSPSKSAEDDVHISSGRSEFTRAVPAGRRLPAAAGVRRPASRSRCRSTRWPPRCARWSGPPRPTTTARCSPACSWPPRAPGCAWLRPIRTDWQCATSPGRRCWRRGKVLAPVARALAELQRLLSAAAEITLLLGERDATPRGSAAPD